MRLEKKAYEIKKAVKGQLFIKGKEYLKPIDINDLEIDSIKISDIIDNHNKLAGEMELLKRKLHRKGYKGETRKMIQDCEIVSKRKVELRKKLKNVKGVL